MYEDEHIIVRPSPIEGLGVFAKRSFEKGETVLRWKPRRLTEKEASAIPEEEKRYLYTPPGGTPLLMQVPERYVNSSDQPNTRVVGETDVAIRPIQQGEEVTSNYKF